jgi:hypothetical protein
VAGGADAMSGFDLDGFRKNINAQLDYVIKHEAGELFEEVLTDLVKERLHDLTLEVLNNIAEAMPDSPMAGIGRVAEADFHLSPLDIDHRALVKAALKREMANVLKPIVKEKLK